MYRQYLTRDRLAFVASVVASARACQGSVPFVSRWYAAPASTMGEALNTTRSRELNRNDTRQRAPGASRTPGLCAAAQRACGVCRATGAVLHTPQSIMHERHGLNCSLYIDTIRRFVLHGALCCMALCVTWRFVLRGALCCMALCATWRFPGGAFRASLCGAF